jgi:hypothetical protein
MSHSYYIVHIITYIGFMFYNSTILPTSPNKYKRKIMNMTLFKY